MASTGGGAQQADLTRDHSLDGLAGFWMFGEGGILDALLDLVTPDLPAFFRRDGFVNVGGHV